MAQNWKNKVCFYRSGTAHLSMGWSLALFTWIGLSYNINSPWIGAVQFLGKKKKRKRKKETLFFKKNKKPGQPPLNSSAYWSRSHFPKYNIHWIYISVLTLEYICLCFRNLHGVPRIWWIVHMQFINLSYLKETSSIHLFNSMRDLNKLQPSCIKKIKIK